MLSDGIGIKNMVGKIMFCQSYFKHKDNMMQLVIDINIDDDIGKEFLTSISKDEQKKHL